ncbi:unnamed protein product, partial [Mesorhabditis belari]|uniref:Uncharacterized protein n=1 Tax=Mesorhabditis belari TaxID=2138241 RepID=A0AAF3FCN2_9BILA
MDDSQKKMHSVTYAIILSLVVAILCVIEFLINLVVIYAIYKGRLWRQNSTYALSLGNVLNDQFLLICHLVYLVPGLFLQSYLSSQGTNGFFPSASNWGLLAGWYVTSFTLAYIAITRFVVIVFNWTNLTYQLAFLSMLFIYAISWTMSVIAQFVFPCCQMVMDPFSYGYALQFCAISLFYVFNWVSTRVNQSIFGSNIEWYSCGIFFLIFNCGANGVIYVLRNKEVKRTLFGGGNRSVATLSLPQQSNTEVSLNRRKSKH